MCVFNLDCLSSVTNFSIVEETHSTIVSLAVDVDLYYNVTVPLIDWDGVRRSDGAVGPHSALPLHQ